MEDIITLSYGNGGKKTSKLINDLLLPSFDNEALNKLGDGALLTISNDIAFSTDSFVIYPYEFPGGDIGKLSVCGTVNDLLMCGSIPRFLSLAFIIEEGLKISDLKKIVSSIKKTADAVGVKIVTGDTKVVDKGHGHGIYINTAGIGERLKNMNLSLDRIEKGDAVILSGSCGNHGVSILCAREGLIDTDIKSDCAVLKKQAEVFHEYGSKVKIMRDPTRGGVATTLNEFTEDMPFSIEVEEKAVPVDQNVKAACNLLGIEALYSANEGKMLSVVSNDCAEEIVSKLRKLPESYNAAIIGHVVDYVPSKVILKGETGGKRILDKLSYDMLPRIC